MDFVQYATPLPSEPTTAAGTPRAGGPSVDNRQRAGTAQHRAPSDEIREFVLAANVAAQDATQDPAASAAPERVVSQLAGSAESATYLFALCDSAAIGEVSELGYPLISSTENPQHSGIKGHAWPGGEASFAGFIHLTLPLLEDTDIAEIECVLDLDLLPLPGAPASEATHEVTAMLVAEAEKIATRLGRGRAQVTLHHGSAYPVSADPFHAAIVAAGYLRSVGHIQAFTPRATTPSTATAASATDTDTTEVFPTEQGYRLDTWCDYDIPEAYAAQVRELLTVASVDVPSGELKLEPIEWTPTRMAHAAQRLRARGGTTLLVALVDEHNDEICALTEIARHRGSDPAVAEWTLTVTGRSHRHQGLATAVKAQALRTMHEHWPSVERVYGSIPEQPGYMRAIYRRLQATELSCSSTWEKRLLPAGTDE